MRKNIHRKETMHVLVLDIQTRRVWLKGDEILLTRREFAVLAYFARHRGRLLPVAEILGAVWGSTDVIGDEALRTVIKRLRRKLGDNPRKPSYITNVWGRGYRFDFDAQFIHSIGVALVLFLGLLQPFAAAQAQQTPGFRLSGRNVLDANGNVFVIRGINHAHTWYTSQTSSFANIKATGANTIRVVLSNGHRWTKNSAADVANVIQLCKTNKLICMLEVHDTTGYGEDGAAASLSRAVTYWKEIQSVLTGQEAYVMINIGNEPYGNNNYANWVNDTKNAIVAMRQAGFKHLLVVDAPNWRRDWFNTMRDNAVTVANSDPDKNTLLSVHMYGVYDTAAEVKSYINSYVSRGLPLLIGEFGFNHSDGNPDEDTIMAEAQANGIGYLGWSWSGNGGGVEYLDMVTSFNPNQVTSWGNRIVNGANGLKQTSQQAGVYGGATPTNTPVNPTGTPVVPTSTPTAGGCKVKYSVTNDWGHGFTADVTITNQGPAINGWTLAWTFPGNQQITNAWNTTASQNGAAVTARNVNYNAGIPTNGTVSFGFQASYSGANAKPTSFTLNGKVCSSS
jgi:mannan endo-1,4-beta-mannosidase